MASIDDLFRKPNVPLKRKLEDPSTTFLQHHQDQSRKALKLDDRSSPHNGASGSTSAYVADEEVEDDDDLEAGPSLPPDDENEPDEDDEGRFFGSGVSKREREVLDYIDDNDEEETEEKIDISWLKKTAINFERKINKNAELRAKFEDDPLKFVGSEADLDGEIKGLSLLSEHPELYKDFARLGCTASLTGLLAHENTDIAISVCQLLEELTGEDSGAQEQDWRVLVEGMIEADVADLLVSNLDRLDETNENDRDGTYHVLSVIENLLSDSQNIEIFGKNLRMLKWLIERIQRSDTNARAKVGQNRQYAAEILAILLQGSEHNRGKFINLDGVDVLLQLLSAYRKRDPEKESDEEEFVENLFDSLVSVAKDRQGASKFLEGEGVELCLIMLKEGKFARSRALRVLDHALSGQQGRRVGEHLVEAAGLKTVFSIFFKNKRQDREITEHLIGMFASLLRYLPSESAARIRTLAKFVEKDFEKTIRLVDLRKEYAARIQHADLQIGKEKLEMTTEEIEESEAEWLSRRFDAGLFTLQTLDIVLTWLVAEDDGAKNIIIDSLGSKQGGLQVLRQSLQTQLKSIDPDEGQDISEMLEALLKCLG